MDEKWKISLHTMENGTKIYIVNGEYIRDNYDGEFTEGGHHLVYPKFIPKNEVWIEKLKSPSDMKEVLLHELFEYHEMKDDKLDYEHAHQTAADIEDAIRSLPDYKGEKFPKQHPFGIDNPAKSSFSQFKSIDELAKKSS